jgi:osmoprotectant transport system permease protein
MDVSMVAEHVRISLVPWLIGVVLGGGLGTLGARLVHALLSSRPGLRKPSMLVPWRALLMSLLLLCLSPASVVIFGLGPGAGAVTVGLSTLLLAMPLTAAIVLEDRYPSPLAVRLVAGARTLGIAAVALAAAAGVFGGGGLGPFLIESMRLLQWGRAFQGWLALLMLALILDLLLGGLQWAAFARWEKAQ